MPPRDPSDFAAAVDRRREARMRSVDALPADIRALVHEYGLTIVSACLQAGVRKARHIRHVVETVLNERCPTRSPFSSQGEPRRRPVEEAGR